MIESYSLYDDGMSPTGDVNNVDHIQGEWVRFEDFERVQSALRNLLTEIVDARFGITGGETEAMKEAREILSPSDPNPKCELCGKSVCDIECDNHWMNASKEKGETMLNGRVKE